MKRSERHPLDKRLRPPYAATDREPCPRPGCITIPNGYNEGPTCLLHAPEQSGAERSRQLDRDARAQARERRQLEGAVGSTG